MKLAVLWHLHQPDYRDPASGRPVMPWVRLHALRGYRDLLVESVERELPVTLNLVPSLVDQLLHYAGGGDDRHLELVRTPAEALLDGFADEAVATLPAGHPAMTRAWPAYAELRARLAAGPRPDAGALRDLQVWSTLAWFGATAHRDFPVLAEVARKGRGFHEDDKAAVLAAHDAVLRELPDRLARLGRTRGPAVSCSPYFHPILPLLVDARHARRSLPELPDDVAFAWPSDALRQLRDARERIAAVCGVRPVGLWPSEGSVSPEVIALAAEAGFRWVATDEGVLARSARAGGGRPGGWDLGCGVTGFFRDTDLSDRIGFRYAERHPAAAAEELLRAAADRARGGTLVVALDGENPWESYADAGGAFRRELYDRLARGPVRPVTIDAAAEDAHVGRVSALWTGSWIGADLRIWIGHPEDRAAWRLLALARAAAEDAPPDRREAAMRHLLAAEGSDWFWWYGDDFRTPWAGTFDALFRAHLRAAWAALGRPAPPALDRPIAAGRPPVHRPPQRVLPIDWARAASWVAWAGAGEVRAAEAAMAEGASVRGVSYGWSADGALWVRVDARGAWSVVGPAGAEVRGPVARIAAGRGTLVLARADGVTWPAEPLVLAPADGLWDV